MKAGMMAIICTRTSQNLSTFFSFLFLRKEKVEEWITGGGNEEE